MEQINKNWSCIKFDLWKKADFQNVEDISKGMKNQLEYDTLKACKTKHGGIHGEPRKGLLERSIQRNKTGGWVREEPPGERAAELRPQLERADVLGKINYEETILRRHLHKIQFMLANIYWAPTKWKILSIFPLPKTSEMGTIQMGQFHAPVTLGGAFFFLSYKQYYCKRALYTFIAIPRRSWSPHMSLPCRSRHHEKRLHSLLHISTFISAREHHSS